MTKRIVKEMKVKCWCGIEGHLQQRGNSYRVGHYKGYEGKTRIIQWHKIKPEQLITITGKQKLVNKKEGIGSISEKNLNQMRDAVFALYFQSGGNAPSRL